MRQVKVFDTEEEVSESEDEHETAARLERPPDWKPSITKKITKTMMSHLGSIRTHAIVNKLLHHPDSRCKYI